MVGSLTKGFYHFVFSADLFGIIFMVVLGFIACYTIIGAAAKNPSSEIMVKSKADPQIAVTITMLLFILYVLFCGIQAIYLFTGGFTALPDGFTYAQYARRGFFELLAITCFNILLILLFTNIFRKGRALRSLLTAITGCTYIIIASAAYRMLLYIGAYHMSFLRLFVLLFLLIDALVLAGIIISIYNKSFPLFGYCVAVVSICYLIFSFGRPDYFIARYNISHTKQFDLEELSYLVNDLSYDAAPAVLPFLNNPGDKVTDAGIKAASVDLVVLMNKIQRYYAELERNYTLRGIRDYNYSVSTAHLYAVKYPVKGE